MGSEGYFINQFIARRTNHRTDRWGGSFENRIRLPLEILRRVRKAVGEDFIIVYRLSMIDLVDEGSTWGGGGPSGEGSGKGWRHHHQYRHWLA